MSIQERLNLERENVQLKKELSVLKRKMELLESNRSLNSFSQHLIDKMQAIIFIKDVTNGFRYYRVNDAFCSIQHLSRQEVIGKTDYDLFSLEEAEKYRRDDEATVSMRGDFTLRDALSKAEQADTLKAQFIANMSHEIRTPLNSIIGFSQLMAEAENQTDRDEYNRIISLNNNLLLNLFEDVLNLSMLDSDNMSFKNDEFDFSAMFDELAVLMREKVSNPEVEFICENPLQTLMVKTDRERLTQVIGNLITNAAKFTGQGYIKMGYARKNDGVQIYVEDTGLGIEEKNLVEVFDRFKKLNVFIQGTGLGLPICKSIVNQMGGEIWVESEYGKGSTFYVWLPCLC